MIENENQFIDLTEKKELIIFKIRNKNMKKIKIQANNYKNSGK